MHGRIMVILSQKSVMLLESLINLSLSIVCVFSILKLKLVFVRLWLRFSGRNSKEKRIRAIICAAQSLYICFAFSIYPSFLFLLINTRCRQQKQPQTVMKTITTANENGFPIVKCKRDGQKKKCFLNLLHFTFGTLQFAMPCSYCNFFQPCLVHFILKMINIHSNVQTIYSLKRNFPRLALFPLPSTVLIEN